MTRLLDWLFGADPPAARVLFRDYVTPEKWPGERPRRFVDRMCRPYLRQYGEARWTEAEPEPSAASGCYGMEHEDGEGLTWEQMAAIGNAGQRAPRFRRLVPKRKDAA